MTYWLNPFASQPASQSTGSSGMPSIPLEKEPALPAVAQIFQEVHDGSKSKDLHEILTVLQISRTLLTAIPEAIEAPEAIDDRSIIFKESSDCMEPIERFCKELKLLKSNKDFAYISDHNGLNRKRLANLDSTLSEEDKEAIQEIITTRLVDILVKNFITLFDPSIKTIPENDIEAIQKTITTRLITILVKSFIMLYDPSKKTIPEEELIEKAPELVEKAPELIAKIPELVKKIISKASKKEKPNFFIRFLRAFYAMPVFILEMLTVFIKKIIRTAKSYLVYRETPIPIYTMPEDMKLLFLEEMLSDEIKRFLNIKDIDSAVDKEQHDDVAMSKCKVQFA